MSHACACSVTPSLLFDSFHVQLFVTSWTVACQAPLSMGFLRQESWSELPFPSPGDLRDPGNQPESPVSPALAGGFFTPWATWGSMDGTFTISYVLLVLKSASFVKTSFLNTRIQGLFMFVLLFVVHFKYLMNYWTKYFWLSFLWKSVLITLLNFWSSHNTSAT